MDLPLKSELQKKQLNGDIARETHFPAILYINPGGPPYNSLRKEWETQIALGIKHANHVFIHVGATSAGQLDEELAQCNEVIQKYHPTRKFPRLISLGQSGGVPWTVAHTQVDAALKKCCLIERPPFHGYLIPGETKPNENNPSSRRSPPPVPLYGPAVNCTSSVPLGSVPPEQLAAWERSVAESTTVLAVFAA